MKRILILGCGGTAAANFIKCLRMYGHNSDETVEPFHIVGTDLNQYQLQAANVDARYLEDQSNKDFTGWINDIIEKEKIEFVYAAPDIWVKRLGQRRDEINARVFLPHNLTLAICQDKFKTYEALLAAEVPVPESYKIETIASGVMQLAELFQKHPVVWIRAREGAGSRAALPCRSTKHFEMWVDYWQGRGMFPANFMVSEFLPGPEYAVQLVYQKGVLRGAFCRERLEYVFGHLMPSGQSSSPSVAKWHNGAGILSIADKAVYAVDPEPNGVYGVDMKTSEDNRICVTEINAGRFYTTSDFAAAVGVNLPKVFVSLAYGEPAERVPLNYREAYWVRGMDREPFLWTK